MALDIVFTGKMRRDVKLMILSASGTGTHSYVFCW
jgi:hypothetical protein